MAVGLVVYKTSSLNFFPGFLAFVIAEDIAIPEAPNFIAALTSSLVWIPAPTIKFVFNSLAIFSIKSGLALETETFPPTNSGGSIIR